MDSSTVTVSTTNEEPPQSTVQPTKSFCAKLKNERVKYKKAKPDYLECCCGCCFDHNIPFLCVFGCGDRLLSNTSSLENPEKFIISFIRFIRYLGAILLAALRIVTVSFIVAEYRGYKDWSTRGTVINWFYACAVFLGISSVLHVFMFYWDNRPRSQRVANSDKSKLLRLEISEWLSVVSDILFLTANLLYFIVALRDNCFRLGAKNYSFMDEVVTKGQRMIFLPCICLIGRFITAFLDMLAKADNEVYSKKSLKIRDLTQALLVPLQFLASIFAFCLLTNGLCVLNTLDSQCSNITFNIKVDSHIRYVLSSRVAFPDPLLGVQYRTKVVDIRYHSYLINEASERPNIQCTQDVTGQISNGTETDLEYCNSGIYNYIVSTDTHKVGTSKGILVRWPCSATVKLRTIRPEVQCFYRVKVQINGKSEFVYNYDYIYQLPESTNRLVKVNEWNRRSKYGRFDSFINAETETNFDVFRSLFEKVDNSLANFSSLELKSDTLDILASEPHLLYIECSRSCFCYHCIANDAEMHSTPQCFKICYNTDIHAYRDHDVTAFCQPQDPDRCKTEWKPISEVSSQHDVKTSDVATFQTPPSVLVILEKENVTAQFDPHLSMESPDEFVGLNNCRNVYGGGITVLVISIVILSALLIFWCKKHNIGGKIVGETPRSSRTPAVVFNNNDDDEATPMVTIKTNLVDRLEDQQVTVRLDSSNHLAVPAVDTTLINLGSDDDFPSHVT